jgi:adenine phosphoribosyltransferase
MEAKAIARHVRVTPRKARRMVDLIRGKKILLVDDVISTGGSLKAMEALVEKAGGTVTGRMAVLAEGGAADRKDILFLEKLPVFNADGSVK